MSAAFAAPHNPIISFADLNGVAVGEIKGEPFSWTPIPQVMAGSRLHLNNSEFLQQQPMNGSSKQAAAPLTTDTN